MLRILKSPGDRVLSRRLGTTILSYDRVNQSVIFFSSPSFIQIIFSWVKLPVLHKKCIANHCFRSSFSKVALQKMYLFV